MRIEDPAMRSPRDSGSRMAEGLFTSEMGIRSDDTDKRHPAPSPTPTAQLTEFTPQAIFGRQAQPAPLQRRAEATVTVAAAEVVVNVNDGSSTIVATTLPPVQSDTVISLENLGSVTIPANVTNTGSTTRSGTELSSITSPPTESGISTTTQSPAASVLSEALNSTLISSTTADTTITVTTTATLDIAYINGTLFPAVLVTATGESSSHSSRHSSTRSSNGATGIVMTEDSTATTAAASGYTGTGGVDAAPTSEAPAATSSESSSGGGGGGTGPALTPQQQTVVGGVVGGVAGVAIILVLILFLLRRYRAKLKEQGRLPEQIAEREAISGGGSAYGMSQRSSAIPLTATLASSLRKFRPMSSHTAATDRTASTAPEGERGFQKIAGRKIAPVLSTGGDGYGGDYGAFAKDTGAGPSHQRNEHSLAGSSFYRDNHGFYGGRGTDSPTYPPSPTIGTFGPDEKAGPSQARDFAGQGPRTSSQYSVASARPEVNAALRPSPARTPVTISPSPSSIRLPIQQTPTMGDAPPMPPIAPGLQVPDGVGRTLSQHDGSRVSARSRGSARSRFAENV